MIISNKTLQNHISWSRTLLSIDCNGEASCLGCWVRVSINITPIIICEVLLQKISIHVLLPQRLFCSNLPPPPLPNPLEIPGSFSSHMPLEVLALRLPSQSEVPVTLLGLSMDIFWNLTLIVHHHGNQNKLWLCETFWPCSKSNCPYHFQV